MKVPTWEQLRSDWGVRRKFLKEQIWYRLPARPLIRFLWMYILCGGFLDGVEGFALAFLISSYEFHINLKAYEIRKSLAARTPAESRSSIIKQTS
jgi:hypothetical protein